MRTRSPGSSEVDAPQQPDVSAGHQPPSGLIAACPHMLCSCPILLRPCRVYTTPGCHCPSLAGIHSLCVAIEIGCVCFLISVFLLQPLGVVLSCSKKMLLQRGPAAHWGVLGADFAAVTPVPTCRSCSEGACGVSLSCWSTCCWCLVPPPHVPPPGSSAPPQAALGELPQGSPLLFQLQPALCRTSSEIKERRSVKPSSSSADGVCGSGRFLCCCNRTAWSSQEAEGEAAVWSC